MNTNTFSSSKEQLFFIQDLNMGSQTVYSGHSGTGKRFKIYQSDYGKYAAAPLTKEGCEKLIKRIEKDAKHNNFKWNLIPIYKVTLCNFWTKEDHDAFEALQNEQKTVYELSQENINTKKSLRNIPQVCIDKIYLAALKIVGSQKTFTRDEMQQLAHKIGSRVTFVIDLPTIIRVLECKYTTVIPEKTYAQLVDEAVENGKSTILYNGQIISII